MNEYRLVYKSCMLIIVMELGLLSVIILRVLVLFVELVSFLLVVGS